MEAREVIRNARFGTFAVVFVPDLSGQTFEKPEEVLTIPTLGAHGSAIAIGVNRFITCSHVIEPLRKAKGSLQLAAASRQGPPEITYLVRKVVGNPNLDLAAMTASPTAGEATPLVLDTEVPEIGTDVVCLGIPFPDTKGHISGGERKMDIKISLPFRAVKGIVASGLHDESSFEVDVQLNPGMSGGPVLSIETGLVLGMCQGFRHFQSPDLSFTANLSKVVAASAIVPQLQAERLRLVP